MNDLKIDPIKNMTVPPKILATKLLNKAGIYINLMGITGVGGGILTLIGIVVMFFSTTVGIWMIGIGMVNMLLIASIFSRLSKNAMNDAMEEVNLTLKEVLVDFEKASDRLEEIVKKEKQKVADSLPKN